MMPSSTKGDNMLNEYAQIAHQKFLAREREKLRADKRLRDAAPDLLAALLKVLPLAETYLRTVPGTADHTTAATIAAARAAIAKAGGTL
jgi:hypothetical protein